MPTTHLMEKSTTGVFHTDTQQHEAAMAQFLQSCKSRPMLHEVETSQSETSQSEYCIQLLVDYLTIWRRILSCVLAPDVTAVVPSVPKAVKAVKCLLCQVTFTKHGLSLHTRNLHDTKEKLTT